MPSRSISLADLANLLLGDGDLPGADLAGGLWADVGGDGVDGGSKLSVALEFGVGNAELLPKLFGHAAATNQQHILCRWLGPAL